MLIVVAVFTLLIPFSFAINPPLLQLSSVEPLLFIQTVQGALEPTKVVLIVQAVFFNPSAKTFKNIPPFGGQQIPHAIP